MVTFHYVGTRDESTATAMPTVDHCDWPAHGSVSDVMEGNAQSSLVQNETVYGSYLLLAALDRMWCASHE
jgi:hypothetical protein